MFLNIFLVLLSIAFATYLYAKRCFSFWADHGVPFIEPKFPGGNLDIIGRKEHFAFQLAKFYNEKKNKKSPIIGLYFFLRPMALVTDTSFGQKILIKDFHHFEDRGLYYNAKADPLSAHLLNLEAAKWKPLRAKLTPTFTSARTKFMFPTIVTVGQKLIDRLSKELKNENEIEIRDLMGRFTTDVIGTCAFGIECNSLEDPNAKFRQMGKKVFDEPKTNVLTRGLMGSNQKLARFFGLRLHHADSTEFFLNIVEQTIEYREKNNVQRNDLMHLLIQLKNDGHLEGEVHTGQSRMTIKEIAAEVFEFFLAGFETTSATLTFALYELAQPHNKHIQDKARAEINNMLAKYDGELTYEGVNELPYVEQVINESLRKYPPVPHLTRIVTKDYECTELKMEFRKGLSFTIPIYAIHHDPDIYEQPDEFRPERFTSEEIKKRPNGSFLPFGDGPRNCIGFRFGLIEARIALVLLLKHFQFSMCDRTPPLPMPFGPYKVFLTPAGGVWIKMQNV